MCCLQDIQCIRVCWRLDIKYTRLLPHHTSQFYHIRSTKCAKYGPVIHFRVRLVWPVYIRRETAWQQWSSALAQTLTCLTGTCVWCESNKWYFHGLVCVVFVICTRPMRWVRFSDDPECISISRHTWKWHNGIVNPYVIPIIHAHILIKKYCACYSISRRILC